MIHTLEEMKVLVSEERIEVERNDNMICLTISASECMIGIPLDVDEAQELRDMLTRALENAEDVRVVEA